jgi:ATP-dependent helicase/nuclease subunit A
MKWTERQLETIELRKKNILVSAAAGSGKTAVLIERIKQLILSDGVDVDRLLVVTFTKAAASEMKEKLVLSLNRAVRENPTNGDRLRHQLDLTARANISTFHSFALDVIRRYFHLIDLDPGFKVCDEAEAKLMKTDAMDHVFEAFFESEDPDFLEYIHWYASPKNENDLKKNLIALYDRIRSIPEPFEWLEWATEQLNQSESDLRNSDLLKFIQQIVSYKLVAAQTSMENACMLLEEQGIEQAALICRKDLYAIAQMDEAIKLGQLEVARDLINGFNPGKMSVPKAQREDYEEIKDHIKGLRDRAKEIIRKELQPKFFHSSLSEYLADMKLTYPKAKVMKKIILEYHARYSELKKRKSLIDFSDIEHFAIDILKNKAASLEYRDKFQYIFIDEYQDSNLLQETIIESIRQEDNVFMVGDIKQSIYKFRLAEPEIFQSKYERFKDPATISSRKIDLNQNFRSKQAIIDAVNGIFSNLMSYDEDAALSRGIPSLDFPDKPVELQIIDGTGDGDEDYEIGDDNLEDMKTMELEAIAAARIIKDALTTTIFDVKTNKERPLRKRDVVILMHGVKRKAETFLKSLSDLDIDAYVDDHAGYFDTIEIMNFMDLLKVVDNEKRDVPLLGVLRSSVFTFSIDDLIEIRSQYKDCAFHIALRQYGKQGSNPVLREKIGDALTKLRRWKKESRYMPIDEFAWKLMRETGYYTYVGALQGGALRQANLRIFVERAKAFRSSGDGSIFGLLRYMNALAEKEVETGQASIVGENDDIVRIMTIHKSKGLEFPFVLVASLGSRFIHDKMEKSGVLHKDIGIGITLFQPENHFFRYTLIQHGIVAKKRKEELDEAVRVLYVAFTRAMDRLVLLGSVANWDRDEIKYESGAKAESNYLGMIYPHLSKAGIRFSVLKKNRLQQRVNGKTSNRLSLENLLETIPESTPPEPEKQKIIQLIDERLSYVYPNEAQKKMKSKYTVSELNAPHFAETTIDEPKFRNEKRGYTTAELGSIMHIVMEHVDLKQFHSQEYLTSYLQDLVDRELLLPEEAATISPAKIIQLAEGDLGKRMAEATVLHREHPFNLLHCHEGIEVMVQGVIDCWFEEDGKIILIDYKTGSSTFRMDERYRSQLSIYKEALETIQGKNVAETYLYLFAEGRVLEVDA